MNPGATTRPFGSIEVRPVQEFGGYGAIFPPEIPTLRTAARPDPVHHGAMQNDEVVTGLR